MLRIRLSRVGKKKQPSYRLVVTESRTPRDGAHLEIVGHYNPLTDPATLTLKEERAIHWLQVGARPSDTAAKLLTRAGVMEKAGREPVVYQGPEVPPGKKGKAEEVPAPAAAPAPAAVAQQPAPQAKAPEPSAEEPAPEATSAETEATPSAETVVDEPTPPEPEAVEAEAPAGSPEDDTEAAE